ncbi:cell agglutination protein Mam3 [Ciborinia camelliae]|nr:cell agglutination protein Mam3 [Ciborinia camelliae]
MNSKSIVGSPRSSFTSNGYTSTRPAILGFAKILFLSICQITSVSAAPIATFLGIASEEDAPKDADDASLWLYLSVAAVLVLLGGAFAGLTIALMGQDGVYLQVIATSGEGKEQRHAQRVYGLLQKGKHWVLVTLLLSNVIVNETLPIVLDRSLGGGWPAVLGSTVLIVIFGEVIPQSICVRYGLSIGAFMAPPVLGLMWLLAPVAWPTAKLLDKLLGEDHGTVYKKSGLKTLVTLHKTLGTSPSDRLNQDEVTIISAVLDLKEKAVGDIMTPMDDVFTMSADTVLDEDTMNVILSAGYSRIPIYEPGNEKNFVGMLLVKILITYDPEDCKRVSDFALATLPETRPETSCLDIVNFFQEGKSHMVLVSEYPGENYGATGVVTLEDVIEELIGEEIIDESDVYIDVHKAIRRMTPAPKSSRVKPNQVVEQPINGSIHAIEDSLIDLSEEPSANLQVGRRRNQTEVRSSSPANHFGTSPKTTFMRRVSTGDNDRNVVAIRGNMNDMREHLKHLGPSNLASRPKTTKYQSVKIKPGNVLGGNRTDSRAESIPRRGSIAEEPEFEPYTDIPGPEGGEGEGLLRSAGQDAKDGVQALKQGYGTVTNRVPSSKPAEETTEANALQYDGPTSPSPQPQSPGNNRSISSFFNQNQSTDTLGSLPSQKSGTSPPNKVLKKKSTARSGSITENVVEAGGIRKMVLETSVNAGEDDKDGRVLHSSSTGSGNKGGNGVENKLMQFLSNAGSSDRLVEGERKSQYSSQTDNTAAEDGASGSNVGTAKPKRRIRKRIRRRMVGSRRKKDARQFDIFLLDSASFADDYLRNDCDIRMDLQQPQSSSGGGNPVGSTSGYLCEICAESLVLDDVRAGGVLGISSDGGKPMLCFPERTWEFEGGTRNEDRFVTLPLLPELSEECKFCRAFKGEFIQRYSHLDWGQKPTSQLSFRVQYEWIRPTENPTSFYLKFLRITFKHPELGDNQFFDPIRFTVATSSGQLA